MQKKIVLSILLLTNITPLVAMDGSYDRYQTQRLHIPSAWVDLYNDCETKIAAITGSIYPSLESGEKESDIQELGNLLSQLPCTAEEYISPPKNEVNLQWKPITQEGLDHMVIRVDELRSLANMLQQNESRVLEEQ